MLLPNPSLPGMGECRGIYWIIASLQLHHASGHDQRPPRYFDNKIVSMHAKGMSVREIQAHLREL